MLPWSLIDLYLLLPAFFLVVCRLSGMVLTAPMYGSLAIPVRIKTAFVLTTSLVLFPVLFPLLPADLTLPVVLAGMAGEGGYLLACFDLP